MACSAGSEHWHVQQSVSIGMFSSQSALACVQQSVSIGMCSAVSQHWHVFRRQSVSIGMCSGGRQSALACVQEAGSQH